MTAGRLLRAWVLACLALLSTGCLFGGEGPESVQDPAIVDFAERIDRFYRSLENLPLDVRSTFESKTLRSYFESEEDFASYYASLAARVRGGLMRNSTPLRVAVAKFRFEAEDLAVVDVLFVGKHTRRLRPGDVEIERRDTWKLRSGRWLLSPEKL